MRGINKSVVYRYLKKCQEDAGGYSGTNISPFQNFVTGKLSKK